LLAVGPRFCGPRGLFVLVPLLGGGGQFVEVPREIERRQPLLAL